jgi:hypothetical protein
MDRHLLSGPDEGSRGRVCGLPLGMDGSECVEFGSDVLALFAGEQAGGGL